MKKESTFFKLSLLTLTFLFIGHIAFSQASRWLWEERFGGNNNETLAGMSKDASGNIYITGTLYSSSFNFGSFTVTDTFFHTYFLAKLNAQGGVAWAKTDGGYGGNTFYPSPGPTAIVNDAAGNTYMTGAFESNTLVVGSYTLVKADTGGSGTTVFVAEYDTSGHVLWAESLGGSSSAATSGIALDARSNIYITGNFTSDSMTIGNTKLTNTGLYDPFTAKLSPAGQVIWAYAATGPVTNAVSNAIATSPDGGVYITGYLESASAIFGGSTITNPLQGTSRIFLTKYDTSGSVLWAITEGDSSYQYANGIATDAQANVYVMGSFTAATFHVGNFALLNDSFGNGADVFLAKFNAGGTVQWAKSAGGNADDEGISVAVGNSDDVYLTGYFWSRPFVIGSDTFSNTSSQGSAMFVADFDMAGNEQWAYFGYGYQDITSQAVVPDGLGNAYLGGYFLGDYMIIGSRELNNADNTGLTSDIFVAKAAAPVTGINEANGTLGIKIFPNPSTGQLNIEGLPQHTPVFLYDLAGRLMLNEETGTGPAIMDLGKLAPGMYILQTPAGSGKIVKM